MTAGEAATRPDVRLRAAGAAKCQDRAVVAVLRGWTRGHASKRAAILAALTAEGVDVSTIPELTELEQEEMRQKPRPCPSCAAKDAELAAASAKLHAGDAALMAKDAELAETERQLDQARAHLLSEMRDWKRQWSEVCTERDAARARVAELDVAWSTCAYCGARRPVDPTSPTNLYCARCRESSHGRLEAELQAKRSASLCRCCPDCRGPACVGECQRRPCTCDEIPSALDPTVACAPAAAQDPPPEPEPPTRPAPRPSSRCHVSLEHDGVDLLAG